MKAILITSFHPLISRNILSTPLIDLLISGGVRVILAVPENKTGFFESEFIRDGVSVAGVSRDLTRRDRILRYLALAALGTRALAIKRKSDMGGSGALLTRLIANRPLARRAIRALDAVITPRGRFSALLGRERPDIVFSTDVQNENDVRLIREAKRRHIPVVGMVRSWDNLTAKGLIRVVPDRLIVHNEIIKGEAVKLHGISEDKISVVGIPHYDRYLTGPAHQREQFCGQLNLDPAKRFVIYAPVGDRYLRENKVDREIIDLIVSFLPPSHHLIVRLPPMDSVVLDNRPDFPNVTVMRPGKQLSRNKVMFRNNELTLQDDELLRDMLFYCDLVVSGPSTFIIDAAVFDKPIILVGFDGDTTPPYYESIRRYWDYDHMRSIISSGGARFARSKEELAAWARRYLNDASLDRADRRRIATEYCWRLDGQSSQRLVDALNHVCGQ
ncbi:MAG: CDP-glycerol glycerophosphotransferase family protein [Candidatus Sungbacteria bacterium]|uniref:CDP-glycerol glycerophosphotransferase family protein n=1 Tax=Candidatus Sungiibacteriota bacterium TaxID=2750080 RepID=A0A932YY42_9BACT|nr:CDP-glycerol glycerophosphotransferase family protein [Candidatus Sungbacteria bacterium]MBI4132324.1 CDP-glycerol glycerophosphotransferase family protein [Candidatus Sungbacteria bacterium]